MKNSIIIFVILLTATTSAQEIELTETIGGIEMEINENGVATVTQDIELLAHETIYRADITIPKARFIEIPDLNGRLEYDSIIAGDEEVINLYFSKPLNAGETIDITIKYSTEFFTNKQGDVWELSFLLRLSNKSVVKIIFPENIIISFTSSEILPSAYVENSRQVLEFKPEGEELDFLCEYKFTKTPEIQPTPTIQATQTINETKKPELGIQYKQEKDGTALIISAAIITLITLAAVIYYFKKLKKPKIKSSILRVLDENERAVVELLQSRNTEIKQGYICKSTKIPKSTLSKIMLRLEERNIIERRGVGRNKWVKLRDWIFE